jgi:hypothetical protein
MGFFKTPSPPKFFGPYKKWGEENFKIFASKNFPSKILEIEEIFCEGGICSSIPPLAMYLVHSYMASII